MKPEKEMMWIAILYSSPHIKDPLNFKILPDPACKKDFERLVDASENNKDFNEWLNKLIELTILEPAGKITKGNRNNVVTEGYIVSARKLEEYAKRNFEELYKKFYKFFSRDRIIQ